MDAGRFKRHSITAFASVSLSLALFIFSGLKAGFIQWGTNREKLTTIEARVGSLENAFGLYLERFYKVETKLEGMENDRKVQMQAMEQLRLSTERLSNSVTSLQVEITYLRQALRDRKIEVSRD